MRMELEEVKNGNGKRTAAPAVKPMSPDEREKLERFEQDIRAGVTGYQKAGTALRAIRDQRLYREKFPTFEAYCRAVWDFSKTQANRLIAAAHVVEVLEKAGAQPGQLLESQIRPLTSVPENRLKAMWAKVQHEAKDRPITAALMHRVLTPAASVSASTKRQAIDRRVTLRDVGKTIRGLFRQHADWPPEIAPVILKALRSI